MKFILAILAVITFFPYIGPLEGLDLQPFFLIALFILLIKDRFNFELHHIIIVTIFALIIMTYNFFPTNASLVDNYFIPLIFLIFVLLILGSRGGNITQLNSYFILKVSYIYIFIGFVQIFYPSFLTQLVSRSTDAVAILVESGRGVRSLCPEPSQFGRLLVSLNALYILLAIKEKLRPQRVLFVCSFFLISNTLLAQSLYSVFVHCIVLGSFVFICNFFKWSHRLIGIFACTLAVFMFSFYLADSRILTLIPLFIENIDSIFNYGASNRLMNTIVSLKAGIFNGSIFGYYFSDSNFIKVMGQDFYLQPKLHGGYMELVYRFGIFGLLGITFILFLTFQSKNGFLTRVKRINFFIITYLFIVPFQYGPILSPLPLLFIAICISSNNFYKKKNVF